MHVGQAAIDPVVIKCELFMVEPEQVQDRGVKIVDVDFVLRNGRADFDPACSS